SIAATIPFTAVFMWAPVAYVVTRTKVPNPWLVGMSLVPSALAAAIPIGTAMGVTIALAGGQGSRRLAAAVGTMALVCTFASFINIAWVVPEANQWFRAAIFATVAPGLKAPQRGESELTFAALSRAIKDWPITSGRLMGLRRLQFAYWN